MSYWIITVGTELITGLIPDENSRLISERLGREGFHCSRQVSVGDDAKAVAEILDEALRHSDGAILTGGLGPTADDLTRESVADALGLKLIFHESIKNRLDEWYARFGSRQQIVYRQAYLPEGAVEIPPTGGSASGFVLDVEGKSVVVLPGPPSEMAPMLERAVPFLKERWHKGEIYLVKVLKTVARSEAWLESALGELMKTDGVDVGIMARPGEIEVQLRAFAVDCETARRTIAKVEADLRANLGDLVYGEGDETLAEVAGRLLVSAGLTIAAAESCTGGLVAKFLTDAPGSSAYFMGGVVAYSNGAKTDILGIDGSIIERFGAVSAECARAMAGAARERFSADIAVSTTGVAGPGSGPDEKPVGLVYIGLATATSEEAWEQKLLGSRTAVRRRAAMIALNQVREYLMRAKAGD